MKKGFLKVICLAGILTFVLPVVGYCDNVDYEKDVIVLEDNTVVNDELFYALLREDSEKVKDLLENGADVNVSEFLGDRPLHHAVFYGDIERVKLLIENGADVNAIGHIGKTPLYYVNNAEIAKLLIENGADVNASNNWGLTALHRTENAEVARVLIENGADVNAKDDSGNTPLHFASNAEVARVLLENGADISTRNNFGETPLDYIRNSVDALNDERSTEIIKVLVEYGAGEINIDQFTKDEALFDAVKNSDIEKVKDLIKDGANVNAKDIWGKIPLHYINNVEIARVLIENGASVLHCIG